MLSDQYLLQAIENLDLLIANAESSASRFTCSENKISKNFYSQSHTEPLKEYLQFLIDHLTSEEANYKNSLYINLLSTLEVFLNIEKNQVLRDLNLRLENLGRHELKQKHLGHQKPANQFNKDIAELPKIQYNPHTGHYTSPDDVKAHEHGLEAGSIFFSTQFERFKGLVNWLFEKINISIFESARYQEHDYLDSEIYAYDTAIASPTDNKTQHYWVGHATNYFVYPNNGKPLHIITDPFEGDMAPVIYPRMTAEGKLIDGEGDSRLPKVDVVIISHNHRDHLSKSTLKKLVKQQPKMIIPKGDKDLFAKLGFTDIVELEWWEQVKIKAIDGNNSNEVMRITAVPARHWSGRGAHDAHRSAFNGYVLSSNSKSEGDIYFAGDTALMDASLTDPIFNRFNISTSIQPGGPDENRDDMESTHQSSVDGIEMHFKMLSSHYQKYIDFKGKLPTLSEFQNIIRPIKTIYNHTSTFKLGNLRLKDTTFSYQRLVAAFNESEEWRTMHLAPHEKKTYNKVLKLAKEMVFDGDKQFNEQELIKIILNSVIIPKIGQRQALFKTSKLPAHSFQYRNLITNRRALVEYDEILKEHIDNKNEMEFLDVKKILISLLDSYQKPWYSFFTRTFKANNLNDRYHQMINDCVDLKSLKNVWNQMEQEMGSRKSNEHNDSGTMNKHGHMQSLIHYGKWIIQFIKEHEETALDKLKEFITCRQIRKLVDQEVKNTGWLFESNRDSKQKAFRTLGDRLANTPAKEYNEVLENWRQDEQTNGKVNAELLSTPRWNKNETTHSTVVVNQISGLINHTFFGNAQIMHSDIEAPHLDKEFNI
ncbi:MAG: MBL fold metallo-hydrolase [Tatlockia sp.]|nr:MBL fold metallo-hydrolase [Tatlockia sp.]